MTRSRVPVLGALTAALAFVLAAPTVTAQNFASAVASGDHELYVGEPLNEYAPGAVYVYRATGGTWKLAATLHAGDASNNDHFGRAIAVDGATMLVGATTVDGERGAAYVFTRDASGAWKQTAKLVPSDIAAGDAVGRAVALSGDLALVSSLAKDSTAGVVYVFRRGASGWKEEGTLRADDRAAGDFFGVAVAVVNGNAGAERVVVGAVQKDSAAGAAYVFVRDASGQWKQEARLLARGVDARAGFGDVVAARDGEIFVSAPGAFAGTGAVFVYRHNDATGRWTESARLLPVNGTSAVFGSAIAFDGDAVLVSAPRANDGAGRIYRIERDASGSWSRAAALPTPDSTTGFGGSIAVGGNVVLVGMPNADYGEGQALIMRTANNSWSVASAVHGDSKGLTSITGKKVSCASGKANIFDCSNVDLLSFLPISEIGGARGVALNDMWGWTDPQTGHEYALIGRMDGTAFVDITDAMHPRYLGSLPKTPNSQSAPWRDIKVYKNHAYVVADGAGPHGMQVFDLTRLRDVKGVPVTFTEDAHYDRIASAHNIVIDTATGFAYTVGNGQGGETCGGGLHMIDIRSPEQPTFAGCFADPATGRAGTGYIHDAQCVVYHGPAAKFRGRELCFNSSETALGIADVTDKKHPVALAHVGYPNVGYTHQGWLTDDQKYFFMDDELDELEGQVQGTRTMVWDVSDPTDPILVTQYVSKNRATDHNLYIVGNTMYESNYVSGLRVLDISDPTHPTEIGFFDTHPVGPDEPGFAGSWSNYPFFKSGTVVVTSIGEGVFMLKPRPRQLVP
ncbi:MAG TPA: choice-of-anchor B family protein [Gemmatimonadaceae bacterium]|nr:choice-of-anchor B family protein [Gemmatimonadaceae bacterium]